MAPKCCRGATEDSSVAGCGAVRAGVARSLICLRFCLRMRFSFALSPLRGVVSAMPTFCETSGRSARGCDRPAIHSSQIRGSCVYQDGGRCFSHSEHRCRRRTSGSPVFRSARTPNRVGGLGITTPFQAVPPPARQAPTRALAARAVQPASIVDADEQDVEYVGRSCGENESFAEAGRQGLRQCAWFFLTPL